MEFPPLPEHGALPALVRGSSRPHIVIVPGFGLQPRTYAWTADLLAARACVIVPHWLGTEGAWSYEKALAGIVATLGDWEAEHVTLIGHSFGGAMALGIAARFPELVDTLVFSDSLSLGPRWRLARSFFTGLPFIRLATYRAAVDFFASCTYHPIDLGRAGWWGFNRSVDAEVAAVRESSMRRFVLWAERDTLLDRDDGREFAAMIGAEFQNVDPPRDGGPVDHDWVYRHPLLFVSMLHRIGVPTPLDDETVDELTSGRVEHGTPGG